MATKLNFLNNTSKPTSNQILIFLQPVGPQQNYLFSAWNVLNPSIGSTQSVILNNEFSGSIATFGDTRGNYSGPVSLPLGKALQITNPNNQSPVIGLPGDSIDKEQVGLQNDAITPPTNLSVTWYVNGNKVVETNNTSTTTLNPGFKSLFQLKQSIFVFLGQRPTETETYTLSTINKTQEFPIRNSATEVSFEVYTDTDGIDKFREISNQQFNTLVEQSVRLSKTYRADLETFKTRIADLEEENYQLSQSNLNLGNSDDVEIWFQAKTGNLPTQEDMKSFLINISLPIIDFSQDDNMYKVKCQNPNGINKSGLEFKIKQSNSSAIRRLEVVLFE